MYLSTFTIDFCFSVLVCLCLCVCVSVCLSLIDVLLSGLTGLQALMPYPIDVMRTWTHKTFPKEDFRYWSFNRLEGEGEVGLLSCLASDIFVLVMNMVDVG